MPKLEAKNEAEAIEKSRAQKGANPAAGSGELTPGSSLERHPASDANTLAEDGGEGLVENKSTTPKPTNIIYKNVGPEEMMAQCDPEKPGRTWYAVVRAEAEFGSHCEQVNL